MRTVQIIKRTMPEGIFINDLVREEWIGFREVYGKRITAIIPILDQFTTCQWDGSMYTVFLNYPTKYSIIDMVIKQDTNNLKWYIFENEEELIKSLKLSTYQEIKNKEKK